MNLLPEIIVFSIPLIIFLTKKLFPENRLLAYLIPVKLDDQKYPKIKLREAGVAYCFLSLWLVTILVFGDDIFSKQNLDKHVWLFGVLFVIPIVSGITIIIGLHYLLIGIFSKLNPVRPKLESMFYVEEGALKKYIAKLELVTKLNLGALLLLIISILLESILAVEINGYLVMYNISLLIFFILTLWRIRAYIVKAAKLMNLPETKILFDTLFKSTAIIFVWRNAFLLIREYKKLSQKENSLT